MTNNIQNTDIEFIEKKFNITSLILGITFIVLGVFLFIISSNFEGNMLSSTMIFLGIISIAAALFLLFARLNREVYTKTNSPIIRRSLYFDVADFYNLKDRIENNDYKSIEKFRKIDEGNVQLYIIHSKDRKFVAMQLLKYEPFDFIPQTEIKIHEF